MKFVFYVVGADSKTIVEPQQIVLSDESDQKMVEADFEAAFNLVHKKISNDLFGEPSSIKQARELEPGSRAAP